MPTSLEDEDLVHWYLDLDVDPLLKANAEPLFVNLVDTWRLRPQAVTAIPNLFLAADYVQTYTDLATMEGANEAARRAVNGILERSGSDAPPCRLWNLHEPVLLEPWRAHDRARYRQGLPWDDTVGRSSGCRRSRRSTAGRARWRRRSSRRSARRCTSRTCCPTSGRGRAGRELLERLTAEPGAPSGELLRAFAAMTRTAAEPTESMAASALETLTSAAHALVGRGRRRGGPGRVRFVEQP